MVGLFVAGCGIPALMRLVYSMDSALPLIVAIVVVNIISTLYATFLMRRLDHSTTEEEPDSSSITETTPLGRL